MSNLDNENDLGVINDRHRLFVLEYIIDYNGARAARAAGFSSHTANQQAYRLLLRDDIQEAIAQASEERKKRLNIDADKVLSMYWTIATADINELVQLRRNNCRYCFGDNNEYQWTVAEYENACAKAVNNGDPEPVCAGGVGFNVNGTPNELCPECKGNGVEEVFIADTRNLSGEASLLYEGVKKGKFGTEIMIADRARARESVAKHLGMFKETVNHVSDDGSMTPQPPVNLEGLSDDELRELAKILAKTESNTG